MRNLPLPRKTCLTLPVASAPKGALHRVLRTHTCVSAGHQLLHTSREFCILFLSTQIPADNRQSNAVRRRVLYHAFQRRYDPFIYRDTIKFRQLRNKGIGKSLIRVCQNKIEAIVVNRKAIFFGRSRGRNHRDGRFRLWFSEGMDTCFILPLNRLDCNEKTVNFTPALHFFPFDVNIY